MFSHHEVPWLVGVAGPLIVDEPVEETVGGDAPAEDPGAGGDLPDALDPVLPLGREVMSV